MPEDSNYIPVETFKPSIEEIESNSAPSSRKIVNGLFGRRYWYESLVEDMTPVIALVFASAQAMKKQEIFKEHPPEVLIRNLLNPTPDLDEVRHQMDYYDYKNFKSGEL